MPAQQSIIQTKRKRKKGRDFFITFHSGISD